MLLANYRNISFFGNCNRTAYPVLNETPLMITRSREKNTSNTDQVQGWMNPSKTVPIVFHEIIHDFCQMRKIKGENEIKVAMR